MAGSPLNNCVRLLPDDDYAYVVPSGAAVAPFVEIVRRSSKSSRYGSPLSGEWNENWEFVVDQEDIDQHPKGLGDCANVGTYLYVLANPRALAVLAPFLIGTAELLPAKLHGKRVTVFNVTRHLARHELANVGPNDVFRVDPVGLDIFVGERVRDAVRAAGITGLNFVPVRDGDRVPMI